jgi:hypothetical protein
MHGWQTQQANRHTGTAGHAGNRYGTVYKVGTVVRSAIQVTVCTGVWHCVMGIQIRNKGYVALHRCAVHCTGTVAHSTGTTTVGRTVQVERCDRTGKSEVHRQSMASK